MKCGIIFLAFALLPLQSFATENFMLRKGEQRNLSADFRSVANNNADLSCTFEISKHMGNRIGWKKIFEEKFSGSVGEAARTNFIEHKVSVDGLDLVLTLVYNLKGTVYFGDDFTPEEGTWGFINERGQDKYFASSSVFSARGEDQELPAKFALRMYNSPDGINIVYINRILCETIKSR